MSRAFSPHAGRGDFPGAWPQAGMDAGLWPSAASVTFKVHDRLWPVFDRSTRRATGQFEISDDRSPEEIAAVIARLGYEPVWKDWDAALIAP